MSDDRNTPDQGPSLWWALAGILVVFAIFVITIWLLKDLPEGQR